MKFLSTCSDLLGDGLGGKEFTLTDDFTLSTDWKPIEKFYGTLNGAGHTITISSAPLISYLKLGWVQAEAKYAQGIVKNLKIELLNGDITMDLITDC